MTPTALLAVTLHANRTADRIAGRRLRRMAVAGPRCFDCAGPLVFGEGCQVCPVCGFSACEVGGRR